jgi:GNAT superfamily N-acetyltransferase
MFFLLAPVATCIAFRITVAPVDSSTTHELADLRYNEWIDGKYPEATRTGFRMATDDMYRERVAGGATAFLAWLHEDDKLPVVAGAAELSPIELEGADKESTAAAAQQNNMLYVTDVVTASAHRRKGVALALMQAIETAAAEQACRQLLLHVEPTNTAALEFYQSKKLGYRSVVTPIPLDDILARKLDTDILAANSGTTGQTLLVKSLQSRQQRTQNQTSVKVGRSKVGRGFGSGGGGGGGMTKAKKKRPR